MTTAARTKYSTTGVAFRGMFIEENSTTETGYSASARGVELLRTAVGLVALTVTYS
jgi:hypothetical protein